MKATVPSHRTGCSCCDAFLEHARGERPSIILEQGEHLLLVTCEPCERSFARESVTERRWRFVSANFASKFARQHASRSKTFAGMPAHENSSTAHAVDDVVSHKIVPIAVAAA